MSTVISGKAKISGLCASGPGSAFTPESISGLTLWIDPNTNVTLDGSDRVSQIVDRSSNAVVFSQATSGNRPDIHAAAINGLPTLRADSTSRWLSSPDEQPSITDFTIFAVYKITAPGTATFFSKGSSQLLNELFVFSGANLSIIATSFDGLGVFQHFYQTVGFPNTTYSSFQILCVTKSGPHVECFTNGDDRVSTDGSAAAYINPLGEQWDIFGRDGSQNTEIAEIIVYDRRLDLTELEQVDTYLEDRFGIATTFDPQNIDLPAIFFVGDSLTAGVGSSPPPRRTMDGGSGLNHSSKVYDWSISAVAGRSIQSALADIDTDLIPYLHNGDIVVVWLGTNDIAFSRTAAEINTDTDAYCQAIRDTGKSVSIVLTTIVNRLGFGVGEGSHDGAESGKQATVNSHIRGLVGGLADAVYDAQAETNLQTTSTAPNTYFQADGTHLEDPGSFVIGDGWITTIGGL